MQITTQLSGIHIYINTILLPLPLLLLTIIIIAVLFFRLITVGQGTISPTVLRYIPFNSIQSNSFQFDYFLPILYMM